MIVDVHTHAWQYPDHFTDDFREQARYAKGGGDLDLTVTLDAYNASGGSRAGSRPAQKANTHACPVRSSHS